MMTTVIFDAPHGAGCESGHGDVTALLKAGVLERVEDGRIHFPYTAVKVEFMLTAAI